MPGEKLYIIFTKIRSSGKIKFTLAADRLRPSSKSYRVNISSRVLTPVSCKGCRPTPPCGYPSGGAARSDGVGRQCRLSADVSHSCVHGSFKIRGSRIKVPSCQTEGCSTLSVSMLSGRMTVNVAPCPSADSTSIFPRKSPTSLLTTANPKPLLSGK